MAGIALGLYNKDEVFARLQTVEFLPLMGEDERQKKYNGWLSAVNMVTNSVKP